MNSASYQTIMDENAPNITAPIPKEMSSIRLIGQSGLAKALRTRVSTPKTTITMPSSEKMAEETSMR